MAYRSRKLHVVAAVAVCSLGLTASATKVREGAHEIANDQEGNLPELVPGGPENLYLSYEKPSVPKGGDVTFATGEVVKKKKELKLKKSKDKFRRRKRHESDVSEHKPRSEVRRRLQKALNIFGMLAEAILSFTECFGENGPLQKLKNVIPPPTRAVFRGAAEEGEDWEAPVRVNCALGAVTKATTIFEDESRPVSREAAVAESASAEPSYFVADSDVLVDQAWQLASWISAQVDQVRTELAVLRSDAESSDSEEENEPAPVVAIRENPTSRSPSPWTVMTPDEPVSESVVFELEEDSESRSVN